MPDSAELDRFYESLTNQELLHLKQEGGFTAEAEQRINHELTRRNLGPRELKHYVAASQRDTLREEATERGGGYRLPGFQFFGRRFLNEADKRDNIQVRTKWFTMSGIPIVPIASYRFKGAGRTGHASRSAAAQTVINRVPLDWQHVLLTWCKTAAIAIGALLLIVAFDWLFHYSRH